MTARAALLAAITTLLAVPTAGAASRPKPVDHETKGATGRVIIVHGGGWRASTPAYVSAIQPVAHAFQHAGFSTTIATYHAGRRSLKDVLEIYDHRHERRPKQPLCLYGESAGGHLALMVAERRSSARAVIAQAAPPDLRALLQTSAAYGLAREAFGTDLWTYSPLRRAAELPPTMLVYGADDPVVPVAQGQALNDAAPSSRLKVLRSGKATWEHGSARPVGAALSSVTELAFAGMQCG